MDVAEHMTQAAGLALTAAEAELRTMLDAQAAGGRVELRQLKETAALLKELLTLCREMGVSADAGGVTVRFEGEASDAAK